MCAGLLQTDVGNPFSGFNCFALLLLSLRLLLLTRCLATACCYCCRSVSNYALHHCKQPVLVLHCD
jgi:hypothetical protein